MIILSHRGYWKTPAENNTPVAFERSFRLGFGTETDLRDLNGQLVISHDPPTEGVLQYTAFDAILRAIDPTLPLALNIKADGLQGLLAAHLASHCLPNAFFFDMSVPDALLYARAGLRFFTRESELEINPSLYPEAAGVWMDMFFSDWIEETHVLRHLDAGKQVCLVSPDLHKRDHRPFWERLAGWSCREHEGLMLCTDFPEDARDALVEGWESGKVGR